MSSFAKNIVKSLLLVPVMVLGVALATPVAVSAECEADVSKGISGGVDCARPSNAADNLFDQGGVFQTVTNILLFLVGAISVIMLIIGGIRYVVSGGDQAAVTSAKNTILYAIIGIVVAFLAYAAVSFVITQLQKPSAAVPTTVQRLS